MVKANRGKSIALLAGRMAIVAAVSAGGQARAAVPPDPDVAAQLKSLEEELKAQRALISQQSDTIERQQQEIDDLKERLSTDSLTELHGKGLVQGQAEPPPPPENAPPATQTASPALPDQPVGEAPNLPTVEAKVQALPEGQGVLTPRGYFVFEPSMEYTSSSTNRLVFRGIELVPGIQIGVIEASDADRDTLIGTATLRYGVTNRLELEARIPYLYRHDRIRVVQQRDQQIVRAIALRDDNIGDVELAARYQINRPVGQKPIYIASLRVKTDTGTSPFEIPFDQFGIATGLATGSGFWAVQPGINFLLPSDPAVIFGGLAYLYHIPRDINREIGGVFVGHVDPGDAITANLGFGFALNPRFSFSLGYKHSYIFPTDTEINDTIQRSTRLQVGSLTLGLSYRFTQKQTVNIGFEFGVTADAPDVSIAIRLPFGFEGPWRHRTAEQTLP